MSSTATSPARKILHGLWMAAIIGLAFGLYLILASILFFENMPSHFPWWQIAAVVGISVALTLYCTWLASDERKVGLLRAAAGTNALVALLTAITTPILWRYPHMDVYIGYILDF